MTRQNQIQKWTVYSLALLLVLLVDSAILSQLPIHGICPILIPLAVVAVAVMEGSGAGVPVGFIMGFIWVAGYGGGYGARIFILTLVGLLTGAAAQYMLSHSFWGYILCSAGTLIVLEIWQVGIRLLIRYATLPQLLPIALTELGYTLCFTPVIYLLFQWVYGRVGGTKLA